MGLDQMRSQSPNKILIVVALIILVAATIIIVSSGVALPGSAQSDDAHVANAGDLVNDHQAVRKEAVRYPVIDGAQDDSQKAASATVVAIDRATGRPIPGLRMRAVGILQPPITVMTGADGRGRLEGAAGGHLTMEKDAVGGRGLTRAAWRIVGFEARRRMRELGTTARPNYVATVYSEEYTRLFVSAVAVLPVLLDEIEELRAPAPESAYEDKDFFHAIHPVPKCCGVNMEGKGNLSLHVLGYKCPSCNRCIHITVTFTEGWPDTDPETIAATDETP